MCTLNDMARQKTDAVIGCGRLVIPARMRHELGLSEGDRVTLRRQGDDLVLTPRRQDVDELRGMFRHLGAERSATEGLIAERRREARREA